jgi:hypothetical protein
MEVTNYAADHQLISALHSVVCIPKRFWKGPGAEPVEGVEFELSGRSWSAASEKLADTPTMWKVTGPVWKIAGPLPLASVVFFRQLWPFSHHDFPWIKEGEEAVFCFPAQMVERDPLNEVSRLVGLALSERESRE